ncbi:MAG: FHA domain-containing protein [Verrucomicrobiota bacterium]
MLNFGRLEGCEVRIPDKSISRKHATIEIRGESFVFLDLGSANGSRINGVDVQGEKPLQNGDQIQIGDFIFEVHLTPSSARESAPIPLPSTKEEKQKVFLTVYLHPLFSSDTPWISSEISAVIDRLIPLCRGWVENHDGEFLKSDLKKVSFVWADGGISHRFKALAAVRTILLGVKGFCRESDPSLRERLSPQKIFSVLHEGSEIRSVDSLELEIQSISEAILVTQEFIEGWSDRPKVEEVKLEGISGLQKVSEI